MSSSFFFAHHLPQKLVARLLCMQVACMYLSNGCKRIVFRFADPGRLVSLLLDPR
jgi:hypothetical protein